MARKVSFSALESRNARLKLPSRRRPYSGPSLARGILLMYRRNVGNGSWVLKASNGGGEYWTKRIGDADDYEDADGKNVLTFHQRRTQRRSWLVAKPAASTLRRSRSVWRSRIISAISRLAVPTPTTPNTRAFI